MMEIFLLQCNIVILWFIVTQIGIIMRKLELHEALVTQCVAVEHVKSQHSSWGNMYV
jgi:hypothetical protein